MTELSNELENRLKLAIDEYLIENINFEIDNIQNLTTDTDVKNNLLFKIFLVNNYFGYFSIYNEYIKNTDIIEIIQYCKQHSVDNYGEELDWDTDQDIDFPYIVNYFGNSYAFDNTKYIIELINKLLSNYDNPVVLK